MIKFLDDGKVIVIINGNRYEFASNEKLARMGGINSKFSKQDELIIEEDDKLIKEVDDKYVYYNNDNDKIYVWSEYDKGNNVSEKIIWYIWEDKLFKIVEEEYQTVVDMYNKNRLMKLVNVLEYVNNETEEIDPQFQYEVSNIEESNKDESNIDDFIDDESQSDIENIYSVDELTEDDLESDISDMDDSDEDYIIEDSNIHKDIMSNKYIEYREEYVKNLIKISINSHDMSNDKFKILLKNFNNYYLNKIII